MKSLVTGGAGFIGSNLVDALLARGDEVTVLDDLSTGRRSNLDGALAAAPGWPKSTSATAPRSARSSAETRPELVFHLAAQIDVRKSVEDPAFDAAVNVGGTANVLEAARATGVGRVVFISTGGALYGEGSRQGAAAARVDADRAALRLRSEQVRGGGLPRPLSNGYTGCPGMSLRLGNVYGPRQDPLGEAGVVAIFCGLVKNGGRPTVYGDGTQTRDYIYVGDVVEAALAAGATRARRRGQHRHRARGERLELVDMLAETGGREDFAPQFAPARAGEVQRISLDAALAGARARLGAADDARAGPRRWRATAGRLRPGPA